MRGESKEKIKMIPIDQISAFFPYYFPLHTSGDIKYGVPTSVLVKLAFVPRALAIPKSPNLTTFYLVKNIFCVFISLCKIFLECMK